MFTRRPWATKWRFWFHVLLAAAFQLAAGEVAAEIHTIKVKVALALLCYVAATLYVARVAVELAELEAEKRRLG